MRFRDRIIKWLGGATAAEFDHALARIATEARAEVERHNEQLAKATQWLFSIQTARTRANAKARYRSFVVEAVVDLKPLEQIRKDAAAWDLILQNLAVQFARDIHSIRWEK